VGFCQIGIWQENDRAEWTGIRGAAPAAQEACRGSAVRSTLLMAPLHLAALGSCIGSHGAHGAVSCLCISCVTRRNVKVA
jgi:hypothetical protein